MELYRIVLVMFTVPKCTHIGTQVQLQLLGSEMRIVASHLCISKIVPGKYQSKNRKLEVLDQKKAMVYPRQEPKPGVQEVKVER